MSSQPLSNSAVTLPQSPPKPTRPPATQSSGYSREPPWKIAIYIFNTLLGILLAVLGVAWAIKSYNITSDGNGKALAVAESANDMAQSANRIALLSNLIQLCGDDNVAIDPIICSEYIDAINSAVATALPSVEPFQIQPSTTSIPKTDTSTAMLTTETFTATLIISSSTATLTETATLTVSEPAESSPGTTASKPTSTLLTGAPSKSTSAFGGAPTATPGSGNPPSASPPNGSGIGPANLGLGALLGIITGVFVGICVLGALIYYYQAKQHRRSDPEKAVA